MMTDQQAIEMIRLLTLQVEVSKIIADNQNRILASLRVLHSPDQRMKDLENSR